MKTIALFNPASGSVTPDGGERLKAALEAAGVRDADIIQTDPTDCIGQLKALAVASVKARFLDVGGEATPMSPAEFKAIAQAETKVFSALIKERGIKME